MLMVMKQTIEQGRKLSQKELEQVLIRVAAGEQEAFALLYHSTRAAVYAMALSILKNGDDAQDVTQDTFVRIWDSVSQYRAQGAPMAWILTISRNLAIMKLRQGARHTALDQAQWDAIPANTPDVTEEDRYLLQEALSILSDEERQIVILHAVSGLKHREIAELLELPLATVLSKYHRALKKLKKIMKGDEAL